MQLSKVEPFNAVEPLENNADNIIDELAEKQLEVSSIDAGAQEEPLGADTQDGLVRLRDYLRQRKARQNIRGSYTRLSYALRTYELVARSLKAKQRTGTRYDQSA